VKLNEREHATVLAALRLWQARRPDDADERWDALHDIAENGGEIEPLDADEIDALCERINVRERYAV
jgi:hypothetical protein